MFFTSQSVIKFLHQKRTDILYITVIFSISFYLCTVNYEPGTWLSGWDTLHPEMNLKVYWNRILNSVWQEHQGLGAVATQAHASEIPRAILLTIFSIFVNASNLRWMYVFLCLISGPIGIYVFLNKLFQNYKAKKTAAFVGGLFFLLNLGTLQQFYAPLEMFVTLYGFIGWIFLSVIYYFDKPNLKRIFIYLIVLFFAAPMAHTPTLWVVFLFMLCTFLGLYILSSERSQFLIRFRNAFVLFILTIIINSFWLLPTIYFTTNYADDVANAKITRLVSEEGILNNQEYSGISDVALLKGYLFNWRVHVGDQKFNNIFIDWDLYYFRNNAEYVGYVYFVMSLIGLVVSILFCKKSPLLLAFIPIYLFSIFFLHMNNWPFGGLYFWLQSNIPLLKEALRFPYTKFSIFLMFAYSLYSGFFIAVLLQYIPVKFLKISKALVSIFALFSLYYFTVPAFHGNLIGDIEKVRIPRSYFAAFEKLNTYPESRIAQFPPNTMYGWVYYDWEENNKVDNSYQGAGFVWFLSKNPILDREFDRWFPTNEDFYNEIQYAYYKNDLPLIKKILNKYDVNLILIDKSVIAPGSPKSVHTSQITEKLRMDPEFTEIFSQENLLVFQLNTAEDKFIKAPTKITELNGSFFNSSYDGALNYLPYIDNPKSSQLAFPFADDSDIKLMAKKLTINLPEKFSNQDKLFLNLPEIDTPIAFIDSTQTDTDHKITIDLAQPQISDSSGNIIQGENLISFDKVEYTFPGTDLIVYGSSELTEDIDFSSLEIKHNKFYSLNPTPLEEIDFGNKIYSAEPTDCFGGEGTYGKSYGNNPGSIILESLNRNICLRFDAVINADQDEIISIEFDYRNTQGSSPIYCLLDGATGECVNDKQRSTLPYSDKFQSKKSYININKSGEYFLMFINETSGQEESESVEFKGIKVKKYKINEIREPLDLIIPARRLSIYKSAYPLTVDLSKYVEAGVSFKPNINTFNADPRNCDNYNKQKFDRIFTDGEKPVFEYIAEDAISCDNLNITSIPSTEGLYIYFNNENISGKYLDVCLYSSAFDKCILSDRLLSNKNDYIVPPYEKTGILEIGIGNQSIGDIPTINKLYGVDVYPIPYNYLKRMFISSTAATFEKENGVIIIDENRLSQSLYEVKLGWKEQGDSEEEGFLVLNQSFADGWVVYSKDDCLLSIASPLTCKSVFWQHMKYNNWANSWIIPTGVNLGTYYILFWPQWLQFYGYFAIICCFTSVGLYIFLRNIGKIKLWRNS